MSYVLAKSQDDDILSAGECGGAVTSIFKYLLDSELVDGVLTIMPCDDIYDAMPVFITDSVDLLKTAGSYHCAPTMIGDLVEKYCRNQKIAMAVKPCDMRAMDELIKRHKINKDNLYFIGLNCGGTV